MLRHRHRCKPIASSPRSRCAVRRSVSCALGCSITTAGAGVPPLSAGCAHRVPTRKPRARSSRRYRRRPIRTGASRLHARSAVATHRRRPQRRLRRVRARPDRRQRAAAAARALSPRARVPLRWRYRLAFPGRRSVGATREENTSEENDCGTTGSRCTRLRLAGSSPSALNGATISYLM